MHVSLEEQRACIRREMACRERDYPAHVARGRMTQAWADYQLAAMRAVLATLGTLHDPAGAPSPAALELEETPC